MPYFAPPGGRLTAEYARALMGLNAIAIAPRYARPPIPTAIVMVRAARTAAGLRAAQSGGVSLMMSGMGLGIVPSVNVRYVKSAIPAALASRRWRELHPQLRGLDGKAAAKGMPMIRRQAGFFMGPGGGPGGGPFQFPGFVAPMRGLGLGQDSDICNSETADNYFLATGKQFPGCGPVTPLEITNPTIEAPTTLTPPSITMPPIQQTNIPFFEGPSGVPQRFLPMPGASFFKGTTFGVSNAVLAVGAGAIVLLALVRRRRRNPSRNYRRHARR